MSRFKSYLNQKHINDSKTSPPRRHITQVNTIRICLLYQSFKINVGNNDDDDDDDGNAKPPVPPTRHPMVNRLTSSIDEALVNLTLLSQDAQREQQRVLYELEQMFIQLRRYIEKYYHQHEDDIKSAYTNYDQHLVELKSQITTSSRRTYSKFYIN